MSCRALRQFASDADIEYVQLLASYLALAHGWKYLMAAEMAASRFSCPADVAERRAEYAAIPKKHTNKTRKQGLSLDDIMRGLEAGKPTWS